MYFISTIACDRKFLFLKPLFVKKMSVSLYNSFDDYYQFKHAKKDLCPQLLLATGA